MNFAFNQWRKSDIWCMWPWASELITVFRKTKSNIRKFLKLWKSITVLERIIQFWFHLFVGLDLASRFELLWLNLFVFHLVDSEKGFLLLLESKQLTFFCQTYVSHFHFLEIESLSSCTNWLSHKVVKIFVQNRLSCTNLSWV